MLLVGLQCLHRDGFSFVRNQVRQLAMAAPSSPLVVSTGRRNVTLSWHCPSEGGAHSHTASDTSDKAVKGYSIVWHAQSLGPEVETAAPDTTGNRITMEELRAQVGVGVPSHNHTSDEELDVAQHRFVLPSLRGGGAPLFHSHVPSLLSAVCLILMCPPVLISCWMINQVG